MIYQPSFQVVTLHLTFSSTGCEPAETQSLLKGPQTIAMVWTKNETRTMKKGDKEVKKGEQLQQFFGKKKQGQ